MIEIPAQTTHTLRCTVLENELAVTDAAMHATVFDPWGRWVATVDEVPHVGAGDYLLTVDPAWSTDQYGDPIYGTFTARFVAVYERTQTIQQTSVVLFTLTRG